MRIVVGGASGLIGSALVPALRTDGHEVIRLVRREPSAEDEVRWSPQAGIVDTGRLGVVDAGINLAGAGVGDQRWTAAYRRTLRSSRVTTTRTMAETLAAMQPRPRVLLVASGVGYYGDTGDTPAGEDAPAGDTFLAGVVRDWEAAADPARAAGIRVVHLRAGIVVSRTGGAFGKLWPLAKLGLLGRLGSGRQWWSWISLADHVAATRFLLTADDVAGPVNLTAPRPMTNAAVTKEIARAVHRPAPWLVPGPALRLALDGFATELLVSQRAVPERLLAAGFRFEHNDFAEAARAYAP